MLNALKRIRLLRCLKRLCSYLPDKYQHALKARFYPYQMRRGAFSADEPEVHVLHTLVNGGGWVLDVGANVGHYTARFSAIVGEYGRIFAFEPMPETFALLTSNARFFPYQNVTLLNLAMSDCYGISTMELPRGESGLRNYYEARLNDSGDKRVFICPIDSFDFPQTVSLIKIDAEGHELNILRGGLHLIKRDMPNLIVEASSTLIIDFLTQLGYGWERLPESPNYLFRRAVQNEAKTCENE